MQKQHPNSSTLVVKVVAECAVGSVNATARFVVTVRRAMSTLCAGRLTVGPHQASGLFIWLHVARLRGREHGDFVGSVQRYAFDEVDFGIVVCGRGGVVEEPAVISSVYVFGRKRDTHKAGHILHAFPGK